MLWQPCICMPPKDRRVSATFNAQLGIHNVDEVDDWLVATHLVPPLTLLLPLPLLNFKSRAALAWFHLLRFWALLVSK